MRVIREQSAGKRRGFSPRSVLVLPGCERPEIPAADRAALHLVAAGTWPMRLEAQPPAVTIGQERRDLPLPVDRHCADLPLPVDRHCAETTTYIDGNLAGISPKTGGTLLLSDDNAM